MASYESDSFWLRILIQFSNRESVNMEFEEKLIITESRNQNRVRRCLNDRCLIVSTVVLTALYLVIAGGAVMKYYKFCENNKNDTDCL